MTRNREREKRSKKNVQPFITAYQFILNTVRKHETHSFSHDDVSHNNFDIAFGSKQHIL